MRRLLLIFVALFAAVTLADQPVPPIVRRWNNLVVEAKVWAALEEVFLSTPGQSPIEAQRQWEHVRAEFHDIDVIVRNQ